jgi:probable HAF family extracellular repeat protein
MPVTSTDYGPQREFRPRRVFSRGAASRVVAVLLGTTALASSLTPVLAKDEIERLDFEISGLKQEQISLGLVSVFGSVLFPAPEFMVGDVKTFETIEYQIADLTAQKARIVENDFRGDPTYGNVAPLGHNPNNSVFINALGFGTELTAAGYSNTDDNSIHAIKWTLSGGTVDLGTLPGVGPQGVAYSIAHGISDDASVIVGESTSATSQRTAFRWTASDSTMRDLGSLAGPTGISAAYGVNGDGSVVAGKTELTIFDINIPGSGLVHAFRWALTPGTTGGVMSDLDPLNKFGSSAATAVNFDGSVVVGVAGQSGLGQTQAFRWSQATGIAQLGVLPGQGASAAAAVSGDGRIVVGLSGADQSFNASLPVGLVDLAGRNGVNTLAFRWTQATGIQDLNGLLKAAGVNTTGITLASATGITRDGQFIVGNGLFSGANNGMLIPYLVRYCDAANMAACTGTNNTTMTPGIAGLTTGGSVQASVDQLAAARRQILVQEFGLGDQLLGANERIGTGSEVGIFATAGTADSLDGGSNFRIAFGNGFTLLGGMNIANENYENVKANDVVMGALALRYVYDTGSVWRPFAEAGGWGVPDATFTFSRSYMNGAGTAIGESASSADKFYVYGRAGSVLTPSRRDEIAFSLEIGYAELNTGAFAEAVSRMNPFEAVGPAAGDAMTVGKMRAQWTHEFTDSIDATAWAAVANGFNTSTGLNVSVAGIGTLTPNNAGSPTWAEYGARIGYKIRPNMIVDVFADGVSGDQGIGTDVHIGAGFRATF